MSLAIGCGDAYASAGGAAARMPVYNGSSRVYIAKITFTTLIDHFTSGMPLGYEVTNF
jgi:hypothetical protein